MQLQDLVADVALKWRVKWSALFPLVGTVPTLDVCTLTS